MPIFSKGTIDVSDTKRRNYYMRYMFSVAEFMWASNRLAS